MTIAKTKLRTDLGEIAVSSAVASYNAAYNSKIESLQARLVHAAPGMMEDAGKRLGYLIEHTQMMNDRFSENLDQGRDLFIATYEQIYGLPLEEFGGAVDYVSIALGRNLMGLPVISRSYQEEIATAVELIGQEGTDSTLYKLSCLHLPRRLSELKFEDPSSRENTKVFKHDISNHAAKGYVYPKSLVNSLAKDVQQNAQHCVFYAAKAIVLEAARKTWCEAVEDLTNDHKYCRATIELARDNTYLVDAMKEAMDHYAELADIRPVAEEDNSPGF